MIYVLVGKNEGMRFCILLWMLLLGAGSETRCGSSRYTEKNLEKDNGTQVEPEYSSTTNPGVLYSSGWYFGPLECNFFTLFLSATICDMCSFCDNSTEWKISVVK